MRKKESEYIESILKGLKAGMKYYTGTKFEVLTSCPPLYDDPLIRFSFISKKTERPTYCAYKADEEEHTASEVVTKILERVRAYEKEE